MKTIFQSERLRITVPSTRAEWIAIALCVAALSAMFKGETSMALHLLEIGLLTVIAERAQN